MVRHLLCRVLRHDFYDAQFERDGWNLYRCSRCGKREWWRPKSRLLHLATGQPLGPAEVERRAL